MIVSVQAERARRNFKTFVQEFWPIIEPGRLYVPGWHLDAIAEHLQAVAQGDIKRLLVNMPPRHGKSSLISVLWSDWLLLNNPSVRILCGSYAMNLATRDNLKARRVIQSKRFQEWYGDVFQITKDQNAKMRFETNLAGYRMATSVGSSTTGEGGDILVCLCYNAEVTTNKGRLCIGDIVEQKLPVRVLAFDHGSNSARWQKIEKYERNPGRACVRVTLNDGRVIDATTDHPFYVVGRGYVPAAQLTNTDKVIIDESFLSILRKGIRPQAFRGRVLQTPFLQSILPKDTGKGCLRDLRERNGKAPKRRNTSRAHFLQQNLSLCKDKQNYYSLWSKSDYEVHLRDLRGGIRAVGKSCRQSQASLLQSRMSWEVADRGEQPRLSGRQSQADMHTMQCGLLSQTIRSNAWARNKLLLQSLQGVVSQRGAIANLPRYIRQLCILREKNKDHEPESREEKLLFAGVCESGSPGVYTRGKEWPVYGWEVRGRVSEGIFLSGSNHQRTRWKQMRPLSANSRRKWERCRHPSYRLRQRSQRTFKSSSSLPVVSWKNAWNGRAAVHVETLLVRCVESIPTPERVYNLRVAEDHNYFANGVLTHNCDDPHNIDEKESNAKRTAAIDWFDNTWSTRLNDRQTGAMVVVGHRIHEQDVSGHILDTNDGEWTHLNLPAEYDPATPCKTYFSTGDLFWEDPRAEEGELLWEEKFPRKEIEKAKRRHGVLGYSALYGQRPVPPGGYIFNRANERLFTISPEGDMYLLITPSGVQPVSIRSCWELTTSDVAVKDKEQNDYTVFAHWAVTPANDVLLLDVRRGHWLIPKQKEQARLFYHGWYTQRYRALYFEDVGYQSAIGQDLLTEGIPCLEFHPKGDKVMRAVGASIWQEAGKSYFRKDAPWLPDFQKEIYHFPKDAHDDQVDTYSMVCMIVRTPDIDELDEETASAISGYMGY